MTKRDEILLFLKTYIIRKNGSYSTMLYNNKFKKYDKYEYWKFIESKTQFCKSTYEKLYCFIYNIEEQKKCNNCFAYTNFVGNKYQNFCSKSCATLFNQRNMNKEKQKIRNKKISNSRPLALKKSKKTKLERYKDENYNNSNKNKETRLKNNDGIYWTKEQLDKRYKYLALHIPRIIKIDDVTLCVQKHHKNLKDLNKKFIIDNFIEDDVFLVYKFCEYYNFSYNYAYSIIRRLKIKVKRKKTNTENKIFSFIYDYDIECVQGDRNIIKPFEIDIYVPEHKFAIEYNGLLWHSYNPYQFPTKGKVEYKNKHLDKTELCEQKGIQLFHIFENEWLDETKQEIWKSIINEKLGLNEIIDTKDCYVKIVSDVDKDEFLENNHLEGTCSSSINIGLYKTNELLSIMVLNETNQNEYELLRFCTKINISVPGGYSKIIQFFEDTYKPKSIISYDNRRYNFYKIYEELDFIYSHKTEPKSFYYNPSLSSLEQDYDYNSEEMFINKYRRIYDSGDKVYIKKY